MSESDRDETRGRDGRRPHRRVGNQSPGAVSGRSADLSSRSFREKSEDRVRWDPVDEVHYVSTSTSTSEDATDAGSRDVRATRRTRVGGSEREAGRDERRPRRQVSVGMWQRIGSVFDAIGLLPGRIASWVLRHRRLSITVGCIVLAVAIVYGPVQRYYVARRSASDLQAEYDYLTSDNDALRTDLDRLQSEEGIEDEARRRGYTFPDETSENAEGVQDDENQGSSATDEGFSAADIEQPWYIHVLDFIFVYRGVD